MCHLSCRNSHHYPFSSRNPALRACVLLTIAVDATVAHGPLVAADGEAREFLLQLSQHLRRGRRRRGRRGRRGGGGGSSGRHREISGRRGGGGGGGARARRLRTGASIAPSARATHADAALNASRSVAGKRGRSVRRSVAPWTKNGGGLQNKRDWVSRSQG